MKTFLTIIITAIVVGVGVYFWQSSLEPSGAGCQDLIEYKCKESGGEFKEGECDCSATGDEFVQYEEGYCITAIGLPGGEILEQYKRDLELKMLKNELKTFSAGLYPSDISFDYPITYSVEPGSKSFPVTTVRGESGRIEIFKISDFEDRPFGFTGGETQEDIDQYVPKEDFQVNGYDVWLFYSEQDTETQQELQDIVESIKVQ